MAYNFGYPASYQNQYINQIPNQPIQTNGIIWVQGEASAKAYPVAPGNNVLLMDSETERFFIKSTDSSGMPQPLRIFSYEEITNDTKEKSNSDNLSDFVTKEEFYELKKLVNKLNYRKEKKDEQIIPRNDRKQYDK